MNPARGHVIGIIAYILSPIGPLLLLLLRRSRDYIKYFALQSLLLFLTGLAVVLAWFVAGWIVSFIPSFGFMIAVVGFSFVIGIELLLFVVWIIGLISLIRARNRPLPIVGALFDRLFWNREASGLGAPLEDVST